MLALHEIVYKGFAGSGFGLGYFVLVVGEEKINAARVDIEGLAEVLHRHGRALDVPARAAFPEGRLPRGLARIFELPEREIAHAPFVVFVGGDARAGFEAGCLYARELAIGFEFSDGKVDAVLRAVGDFFSEERLDERNHAPDVLGRLRVFSRGEDVQRRDVAEERASVMFRELSEALPRPHRIADGFVIHVGEVHHVFYPPAVERERPPEHVLEHVGAEVPDVDEVVDRRPAGVETNPAPPQGPEFFLFAGEVVIEFQHEDNANLQIVCESTNFDRHSLHSHYIRWFGFSRAISCA